MSDTIALGSVAPHSPSKRHPHPGELMPKVAWPAFGVTVGALVAFVVAALGVIGGWLPAWAAIAINSAVVYLMFLPVHEAAHRTLCRSPWVNAVVGRLAWIFIVPHFAWSCLRYAHQEHHRHTNDHGNDPDYFATGNPFWQLVFRGPLADVYYAAWYLRKLPQRFRKSWQRPFAELAETTVLLPVTVAVVVAAVITGHFWTLAVVVLIPQRIGLFFIIWWFDWLPHHGLEESQRENRYRASRNRVGLEWLMTPLWLAQNYHLVHHLHPGLPIHLLPRIWRRNETGYLEHEPALSTVFGRELTVDEYRQLQHDR
ncbi:fatty acid desaturase [[Mycobacterium] nativiensis]|uniref:Fatty acid desaturase n=1 Tax=[Mycobacterium] nativiensis TaxID=2855503 RepID=A0ABU5XUK2_9MYCO|nr:fatty acid desaturase [Mycolicibacter sp. MYC340]MEB3030425.1 fatty acid desaturase [Mycolicibacter sp. MYC340]